MKITLSFPPPSLGITATVDPEGWESTDSATAEMLNRDFHPSQQEPDFSQDPRSREWIAAELVADAFAATEVSREYSEGDWNPDAEDSDAVELVY